MELTYEFFHVYFPQSVHISKLVFSMQKDIFVSCFGFFNTTIQKTNFYLTI